MKPHDLSVRFLSKASQDELILDKLLDDPDIADEVWGFHAQQAGEKLLKAVLSFHSIRFRKTHDITELMDILIDHGIRIPDDIAEIRKLTPFAVEYRYDDLFSESGDELDRKAIRKLIQVMRLWAKSQIDQ
ncbi:MAG: HEPN domain-containing protein [Methanosarcinaceae archaeon]|nr:HEPN domain-containing protein [Methanosarcinaceae archaeon]